MTDTVTRLMVLADDYAEAVDLCRGITKARQALEAELTRLLGDSKANSVLFTPLSDEQIYDMYSEPSSDAEMLEFARAVERAHGIGGES